MMKKKMYSLWMLVFTMLLAACGAPSGSEDAADANKKAPSTLVYGSGDYTRINPAMDEHGEINALLFDGLTAHNGKNEVVAGLAKSWEFDAKTNTYTFDLKEHVTWHDGQDFTAEDVKFTIEAVKDPAL